MFATGRWLSTRLTSLTDGVTAANRTTALAAWSVLIVAMAGTALWPAHRVTALQPGDALRND